MDAEVKDLIEALADVKNEMKNSLQEFPHDALNWSPIQDEANSPYAIVTHFCGSESFWLRQVVGGIDIHRDRPSEFRARGEDMQNLLDTLERTQASSSEVLAKETTESLSRIVSPGEGRPTLTARSAVLHAIEHGFTHVGHIQLTKQWWERQKK